MYFGFSLKSYIIQYFGLSTSGVTRYLVTYYFNRIYMIGIGDDGHNIIICSEKATDIRVTI